MRSGFSVTLGEHPTINSKSWEFGPTRLRYKTCVTLMNILLLLLMMILVEFLLFQVLDVEEEQARPSIELEVTFHIQHPHHHQPYHLHHHPITITITINTITISSTTTTITIMITLMMKASSEESMQMMPATSKELNSSLANIQRWSPGSRKKLVKRSSLHVNKLELEG